MSMTDSERNDVLAEIDAAYLRLTAVLDSLSSEEMQRPDTVGSWSGKDLLSHIAGWEVEGARYLNAINAGQEAVIPGNDEYDAWNELQVAKTRDWTVDQVRTWFEGAHQDFVHVVRTSGSVWRSIATGLSSHHFDEHIGQFRSIQSGR
jgi:hypothetical protein